MRRRVRWGIVFACLILIAIKLFFPALLAWLQGLQFDTLSIILVAIIGLALVQPYFGTLIKCLDRIHKRWVIVTVCLVLRQGSFGE
jgi:uncharacterized membrane protein